MKKILYSGLLFIAFFALKTVTAQTKKPLAKPSATTNINASIQRGKAVYATLCVACHQVDGGGVPNLNPPLIKTSYVLGDKKRLINILLNGMQGVDIDGETYSNVMPPVSQFSNQQIADVLTYVRNSFGNKASAVTLTEVNSLRPKK
ncbi:c-type cytochrome [Desertivirga arenae]|uniref:c-type cytochrome n=1 Tax=Desertivirga arenae TaxID=2810309 RepID=UPI001F624150|nr:cytochrome c [Pedobacter sp. SYSU D00823]